MSQPIISVIVAALSLAGSGVGVAVQWRFWERRRARRELRLVDGLEDTTPEGARVRVTGVVRALDRTLTSPLSAVECVVYRARVSGAGRATSGKTAARSSMPPLEAVSIVPFELELASGARVLVESTNVLIDLPATNLKQVSNERREQFALRQGVSLRTSMRASFNEVIVTPGTEVTVVGLLMRDAAAEPPSDELAFRDAAPAKQILTGNAEHPIAIGAPLR